MNEQELYAKKLYYQAAEKDDIEIIKEEIKKSKNLDFLIQMAKIYDESQFELSFFELIDEEFRYNKQIILTRGHHLNYELSLDNSAISYVTTSEAFIEKTLNEIKKRYGNDKEFIIQLAQNGALTYALDYLISPELCNDSKFIAQVIKIFDSNDYNPFDQFIFTEETEFSKRFLELKPKSQIEKLWQSWFPNIPFSFDVERALIEISGFRDEYSRFGCYTEIAEDVKAHNRSLYNIEPITQQTPFTRIERDLKNLKEIHKARTEELKKLEAIEAIDTLIKEIEDLDKQILSQKRHLKHRGYTDDQINQ